MKDSFTTFEISKLLGIKRGRLREWINSGFIRPSLEEASGVGSKHLFSLSNIYGIVLFDRLLEMGFKREEAALFYSRWQSATKELSYEEIHDYQLLFLRYTFKPRDGKIVEIEPQPLRIEFVKKEQAASRLQFSTIKFDQIIIINISNIVEAVDSLL